LRNVAWNGEGALCALVLEGGAPCIGIAARAVALVAHVGELLAQLRHQLVGAVAWWRRRVTLLAPLCGVGAGNGRVDAVQFGRVDLPLAVLVAGGGKPGQRLTAASKVARASTRSFTPARCS
jgi:hypothetical protein